MNFSAALDAMKAGKKVRLPEMKDYFLYISTVYEMTFNNSRKVSHIRLTNYKDEQDWTPDEEELLSEKWELVDEYAKAELETYFKCPRCQKRSVFDKKFLLVDPKGRDIIECENCGNKVEIVKKDHGTKACCGEVINPKDPDENYLETWCGTTYDPATKELIKIKIKCSQEK